MFSLPALMPTSRPSKQGSNNFFKPCLPDIKLADPATQLIIKHFVHVIEKVFVSGKSPLIESLQLLICVSLTMPLLPVLLKTLQ